MGRLQLREVALRAFGALGVEFGQRHAIQGLGVLGVQAQQLLPGLSRAFSVTALLPVLPLVHQGLFGPGLRPGSSRCHQRGQQPHGECVVVTTFGGHAFLLLRVSRPPGPGGCCVIPTQRGVPGTASALLLQPGACAGPQRQVHDDGHQHRGRHPQHNQQQRIAREVPLRIQQRSQLAHMVVFLGHQAVHLFAPDHRGAALHLGDRIGIEQHIHHLAQARRLVAGHQHHAAAVAQGRFKPRNERVRAAAGERHLAAVCAGARFILEAPPAQHPLGQVSQLETLGLALQRRRDGAGPLLEQGLIATTRGNDQQILVAQALDLLGLRHRHAQRREPRDAAHDAHEAQVGAQLLHTRPVGHDHGRLRQVGHAGERKTGIAERGQVRHGNEVREAGDVDGRIGLHRAPHVVQRNVLAGALFDHVVVVMHLQLRLGGQLEQRDVEFLALRHRFTCRHHLGEPPVQRTLFFMVHGPQGQRAQELLVHVDVERGLVGVGARGVAVAQVHRDALLPPAEQVGRQEEVHTDQVGRIAGHIERLGLSQFAKLHGPVAGQPMGGVVGLAGLEFGDLGDARKRAGQGRGANRQRLGRHGQLGIVAPHDQQQLAVAIARMAHHRHRGARDFGQHQACGRLRPAGHHHHGVAARGQLTDEGRELRATETRQRTKPGRHRARRLQGARIRRCIEHDGEFERAHVPAVEEGLPCT
eukprot:Opistho-1_new@38539